MSLHDLDKTHEQRLNPSPNSNDEISNRLAHNTMSTAYKTESTTSKQRLVFKNSLILTYDSTGKVSSVYGYIPSVSSIPVFIIANAGYDVFTDILGITAPTT